MINRLSNDIYKETFYAITENQVLIDSMPPKVLSFIKKNAVKSSKKFEFLNGEDTITQLSKEALELYTYFYLKYGNLSNDEKEKIKRVLVRNSIDKAKLDAQNIEPYLNKIIEDDIVEQVKEESKNIIKEYISPEDIGYENELYEEMKPRLDELQIEWSPFFRDIIQ